MLVATDIVCVLKLNLKKTTIGPAFLMFFPPTCFCICTSLAFCVLTCLLPVAIKRSETDTPGPFLEHYRNSFAVSQMVSMSDRNENIKKNGLIKPILSFFPLGKERGGMVECNVLTVNNWESIRLWILKKTGMQLSFMMNIWTHL